MRPLRMIPVIGLLIFTGFAVFLVAFALRSRDSREGAVPRSACEGCGLFQQQTADARAGKAAYLAVRAGALTQEQADCVFHDHPSVLQEFAQQVDLDATPTTQIDVKQVTEALIRRDAVQLDRCFSSPGG